MKNFRLKYKYKKIYAVLCDSNEKIGDKKKKKEMINLNCQQRHL